MSYTDRKVQCACGNWHSITAANCNACRCKGYKQAGPRDMAKQYGVTLRRLNGAGGYAKLQRLDEDTRKVLLGVR